MNARGLLIALVMVLLAAGCSTGSIASLKVGDCFDDEASASLDEVTEVSTVPLTECSEPHDNEVFALYDAPGDSYPGQDGMLDIAFAGCLERFDAFVGIAYSESELEVFPITPTSDGWEKGDRGIICSLYEASLAKMTGSQMGAAR